MAADPGGKEVGRISIRVVPDTSRFAQELKAQLKKLEEKLEVDVPVTLDTARAALQGARLRESLEGDAVEIPVELDSSGAERATQSLRRSLSRGISMPSMDNITRSIRESAQNVKRLRTNIVDSAKATVNFGSHWQRVRGRISGAASVLRRMRNESPLESLARGMIRVDEASQRLRNSTTRVRSFGASLKGLFSRIRGNGGEASETLSSVASSATQAGGGLGKFGSSGLIAAGAAALAAPALGAVATALAGLPSLIAAGGAAFAAIGLGMDGIKKAAETLTPAIDRMKATLSATFQQGLTPVFQQLNTLMPTLEAGLNKVAQGLIPLAQAFTDVVTSAGGMKQIEGILANVGTFMAALAPMVRDATSAFLTLTHAGSQSFGLLADTFNTFAADFRAMVERITSNGSLKAAFEGLNQVLAAVLPLFTQLFEAGVTAMGQLGGPLASVITGLGNVLVALMPALTSLSALVGNVLGAVFQALTPVIQALTPAFTLLADSLGVLLVGAVQALVPILTPLAQILGQVVLTALKAIQPILPVIVDLMNILGTTIGGILVVAFKALTPLLNMAGQFLSQLFAALAPLIPSLLQLALAVIPPLVNILIQLMPLITQLASFVFPALIAIVNAAVPVIQLIATALAAVIPWVINLASQIIGFLIPIFRALMSVVQAVWPHIQGIIEGAMNVIMGVINTVMAIIRGDWSAAWDGVKQIVRGAWQMISNAVQGGIRLVVSYVRNVPGAILGALGNLGSLLYGAGKAIIQGLINGIGSMIGAAVSKVKGAVSAIRDFFPFSPAKEGPFAGRGYTLYSGKALVQDWAKGIEKAAPGAVNTVEDMMNAANNVASAEWNGHITSDGYGSGLSEAVMSGVLGAFNGSRLSIDPSGFARVVNRENQRNARR